MLEFFMPNPNNLEGFRPFFFFFKKKKNKGWSPSLLLGNITGNKVKEVKFYLPGGD